MKKLVKLEHSNSSRKNILAVDWIITNKCNYRCSYCPEKLHTGPNPVIEYSHVKKFCENLQKHYSKLNKEIYINISGGEPTIHNDFVQIIKFFKNINIKVGLISNGSAPIKLWKSIENKLDRLHLSYHSETTNLAHFMEVIKIFHGKIYIHVNVMMHPDNFIKCFDAAKTLANNFGCITVSMAKLYVNIGDIPYNYSEEQLEILNHPDIRYFNDVKKLEIKSSEEKNEWLFRSDMIGTYSDKTTEVLYGALIANKMLNKWKGWTCYAGIENLVVEFNGDYYTAWCQQDGKLGNISDEKLLFPTEPAICKRNSCNCIFDMLSKKESHRFL